MWDQLFECVNTFQIQILRYFTKEIFYLYLLYTEIIIYQELEKQDH